MKTTDMKKGIWAVLSLAVVAAVGCKQEEVLPEPVPTPIRVPQVGDFLPFEAPGAIYDTVDVPGSSPQDTFKLTYAHSWDTLLAFRLAHDSLYTLEAIADTFGLRSPFRLWSSPLTQRMGFVVVGFEGITRKEAIRQLQATGKFQDILPAWHDARGDHGIYVGGESIWVVVERDWSDTLPDMMMPLADTSLIRYLFDSLHMPCDIVIRGSNTSFSMVGRTRGSYVTVEAAYRVMKRRLPKRGIVSIVAKPGWCRCSTVECQHAPADKGEGARAKK